MSRKILIDSLFVAFCVALAHYLEIFGNYKKLIIFFLSCMAVYFISKFLIGRLYGKPNGIG